MLRINPARISIAMVLQALLAGFLKAYPDVQIELTNDEGYVDIVERGFDAGVRMGERVQKDMVAVPLGGPVTPFTTPAVDRSLPSRTRPTTQ